MLHNPNWDKKPKVRKTPLTKLLKLEYFVDWLKTKPQHETYNYMDDRNNRCVLSQYFIAKGYEDVKMFGASFMLGKKERSLPHSFADAAHGGTFGAALEIAESKLRK